MNQTALNVTAIAVFGMTLSALVGPALNLSPAIPAIAVVGILGIATLDAWAWQGQSGTLLIDWLSSFSQAHRDRVLHHEAGHFLAAYVLGIPVTSYALNAWEAFRQGQPAQGGVQFDLGPLEGELQQGLISSISIDRYCTVWMAGAAAEKLVYGNVEGGADDRAKFQQLWAQMRRSPEEGSQKVRWSDLRARTLLETHWEAYEALVAAMKQRASVEDCCQTIDQHLLSPTHS